MTDKRNIYVVVIHKPTRRAFAMNRNYAVIDGLQNIPPWAVSMLDVPEPTRRWDQWTPTCDWQRPAWMREYPKRDFLAVWFDPPLDARRAAAQIVTEMAALPNGD